MEKNCKWHFKEEGGRDVGPNDPVDEKFKGQPYYSIVREAIQNSLDAVKNSREPVKVAFTFFELNRKDYPGFFEIESHINQSEKYYSENDNAKHLFGNMRDYLNGDMPGAKKLQLSCLKISDYNTVGMNYDDHNTNSSFYAFLRAGGVSAKSQGSGGSFGFGKGAYYTLSPIKTIIVSTRDENSNVFFEGSTILTTHKNTDGKKLTAYGYYDNNNGVPAQNNDSIPEIFQRKEVGTDVSIIGLWDETERKELMIKSVLNNFWLAVYDNKLIVQIDNIEINRENIEHTIDKYFGNEFESGSATEIESWNPKPYFKAVKYTKNNEQFQVFEETLETVGKVTLYVYLEKGLPNRTSYFRKPKMVVFKRTSKKVNGYAAVFVCDNDRGNEILRLMENPAHNEWKKENYPKEEGKISRTARKAENEIRDFVNEKLDSLSKNKPGKKIAFLGLEEYLSIPEDLLEKDEEEDFEGMNTNNTSGQRSYEITEDETGLVTTDKNEPVKIKPTLKPQPEVKEETGIEVTDEGEEKVTVGGENENEGGDILPNDVGNTEKSGNRTSEISLSKVLIKVDFKVVSQKENNELYHTLIINSINDTANVELELLVGSDNDRDDGLELIYSDTGSVSKNVIRNVPLSAGINRIKIRFADNLKHSVKLKAYEIQ